MKIHCKCILRDGEIVNQEKDRLQQFIAAHKEGDHLVLTLEDERARRRDEAMRFFYKLRDRYCETSNMDKIQETVRLKMSYGVTYPIIQNFCCNRHGMVVETPDGFFFLVSLNEYKKGEMFVLTEGLKQECRDTQTYFDDLEGVQNDSLISQRMA